MKINKTGQRKNYHPRVFRRFLKWVLLMSDDFLEKEIKRIFIPEQKWIKNDLISTVCQEANNMATLFQEKVYDALLLIPKGYVTTYKILAKHIGCKSSQAIGQALTKNKNAPDIPCHRVIKTDWHIGGYAFDVEKKRAILTKEGVCFDDNNYLIHQQKIWDFSQIV